MSNTVRDINNILNGVAVLFNKMIKKVKFNYVEIGTIVNKNDDNTYKIRINDYYINVKSLHNIEYKINDVVYILIMNQDYRFKLILDKVYD